MLRNLTEYSHMGIVFILARIYLVKNICTEDTWQELNLFKSGLTF